jgi:hypothetical protein
MKRWMIAGSLLIAGCAVERPVGVLRSVPPETPAQCEEACGSMGMTMSAVVLMASSAGCVCERNPGSAPRSGGASAAAGSLVVMMQRKAAAAAAQGAR